MTLSLAWEGSITSVLFCSIVQNKPEYFGKIPAHSIRNIYPLGLKGGVATVTLQITNPFTISTSLLFVQRMLSPSSSLHCTSKIHINCLINSTLGQFKVTSENESHFGQSRPSTLTKIEGWGEGFVPGVLRYLDTHLPLERKL